ncbi:MFS transporter [Scopulibacillus cellulosilyticus]|uniref:MFS transporter n=1 Tax=Scopulibacillus cellulosilyticus TaxID=2665665 RepID=A0ABW2PTG5_9BACL
MENLRQSKGYRTRVLIGSLVGGTLEYYDYELYGILASLVFGQLFFPSFNPVIGRLLAFASFGLTFFLRPVGGIVFSHLGDKIGRKNTLVMTITIMGISSLCIGLLPTYQTIGVWAPILLVFLRLVQGFALGGEWGGSMLLSIENSEKKKRGFYGSVPMMGAAIGLLLGLIIVSIMQALMAHQFLVWGWRIPFIISFVLTIFGLWVRNGLEETMEFQETKKKGHTVKIPIANVVRYQWKSVLMAIGIKIIEAAPYYIFATFAVSYASNYLHMKEGPVLNSVTVGTLFSVIAIPIFGILCNKVGPKVLFVIGSILTILFAYPYFYIMGTRTVLGVAVATIIGMVLWAMITSVLGTLLTDLFHTNVRYTGISVGYQIGTALAGGTAPMIATALIEAFHGSWVPVAWYIIIVAAISLLSILIIHLTQSKGTKQAYEPDETTTKTPLEH